MTLLICHSNNQCNSVFIISAASEKLAKTLYGSHEKYCTSTKKKKKAFALLLYKKKLG